MFRFAVSSDLLSTWKHALHHFCGRFQAQGLLFAHDYTHQWQFSEISTTDIHQEDIVALLQSMTKQFKAPSLAVERINFSGQTLSFCPIWQPNGTLFAAIALVHNNEHSTEVTIDLSALCGRIGFDIGVIFHQEQLRNQQPVNTTLPSLQEFVDGLDDHTWIKSINGEYVLTSRTVEEAWNMKSTDIIGKKDRELFTPARAQQFMDADQEVIATGRQHTVEECSQVDGSNKPIWLETIKSPIRNQAGELIGILGMTRNVTRRKTVENQLSLASTIFNHSHEGMMITDRTANILEINSAFTRITGFTAEEAIGQKPNIIRSGHHDPDFYTELWRQLKTTGQWKGEFVNRRKDGSVYPQLATISTVVDESSHLVNYICVFEDISVRKAHEEKLQRMAFYDPLTSLPNRTQLLSLLEQHIESGRKHHHSFATLFLDIDHFKHINDSLGHFYGDQLLTKLAERLQDVLHRQAHVARIGGDEFVIILPNIQSKSRLIDAVEEVLNLFNRPFKVGQNESLRVSTSIGIACYPQDGQDSETLLKNADTAMYLAKKNGRNGYAFYSPDLTDKSISHVRLQSALHEAIEKNELYLVYQPQYQIQNHKVVGVEALLRWDHPELGSVSPAEFIPIAEKTGLIQVIGPWVMKEACRQGKDWLDQGIDFGKMAINVSALQLQKPGFIQRLKDILQQTQFPADRIDLEITESYLLNDPLHAIESLNQLRQLGVEISLDDFGTGYSSLSYLKGLPINKLKVDRSFVSDVPSNNDSNAIVNAIIAMGKTLSLTVIAEGIETAQQAQYLHERGCLYGQGYRFSAPVSPEALFK
ncbi:sensor domain-containing protein [Vibrio alfacsensis]|uniref:sensor domain-containing protein n=1 Tax=Vibrio alfacsensis TaxID=1074311 RepID=UPI001BEDB36D|nr:GGDEF and EAL domain-containing protein [Vibrio alfacsensis]BCN22886.1 GGDEF domain-containing protein [Vibrio alfacsensis]